VFIFVVRYKQSEDNVFQALRPDTLETAREYVDTPLIEHQFGYLVAHENEAWRVDGLPRLQRRRYCGSDEVLNFVEKLQKDAQPLTMVDVLRLQDEYRHNTTRIRKEMKSMAKKENGEATEAKEKKAKKETAEGGGERAARFAPNPKAKLEKLVDKNPRQEGSDGYKSFELIKNGMTVAKYQENGGELRFLKTEVAKGRVKLIEPAA